MILAEGDEEETEVELAADAYSDSEVEAEGPDISMFRTIHVCRP